VTPVAFPLLDVRGVDVAYGSVRVLEGIDLRVAPGETVALLGTNGAGKSTLLRAISGVLKPRAGTIAFDGEDVTGLPSAEVVKRGIVQMPGGRATFPGLSIEENLRVGASVVPRADRHDRIQEALALFPWLAQRRAQQAGSLSGGEQQMLGLARALIAKPKLLMIDELSLGLAPVIVTQLLDVIDRLRRDGLTVLLVEQHVDLALDFADRAYFLERGRVRFEGPAAGLRGNRELLRAVLLSSETVEKARGSKERGRRL
jgi:branched-chain amino acid transport system ATP-binding protein